MSRLPGIFVTLEGCEGAGKSSLMQNLSSLLTKQGISHIVTREPGGTSLGEKIRSILLNSRLHEMIGAKAELLLFLAARAQHIEEIVLPALKEGKLVICDRFTDSSIAYQGAGRELGFDYTKHLCFLTCDLQPNLTLFLDVDPKLGISRTLASHKENAHAGEVDRIEAETLKFHERVSEAFHLLAAQAPDRIRIIDANLPKETVLEQASQILFNLLPSFRS